MLKAVIFDMDGVLIDSEPVHFKANKQILRKMGYTLDYEYYKQFIGSTLTHMWETLQKEWGIDKEISELNSLSEECTREIIGREGYPVIPGSCELVKMFYDNNFKLAVASSSSEEKICMVVDSLHIKDYFEKLVSGRNVEHPKPSPDVFLKAAHMLGVKPEECLVIEDSMNGVNAAKAANMTCVGFINPNSGDQNLENADYLVESFVGLDISFFEMVYCHTNGEP